MIVPDEGDANRGGLMIRVLWSLAGISILVLALGLYAKIALVRCVRSSDYIMVIALICAIIQNALLTESCRWGLGRHSRYLSSIERVRTIKFIFLCQGWGVASPLFGRVAFCLLLLSFVGPNRKQKWCLWFLIITQAVFNSLTIILIYVQCGSRVSALWDPSVKAKCWEPEVQRDFGFFQSSWNSFTDLALTLLPVIMLRDLRIEFAKKVAIILLLSLSVVALVASIIKAYLIKELGARDDFTWNFITFQLWASAENYIVIICATIPTLKPLVRWGKTLRSTQESYELSKDARSPGRGSTVGRKWLSPSHTWKQVNGSGPPPPVASSQENILPPENSVVKTTDVTVCYSVAE